MNNQPNRLLNIIRNRTSRSQNTERESHSNNFNLNTISDIPLSIQEDSLSNIFQDIESIRNRIPWYFRSGRFRSSVIIQSDSDNDLSIDHSVTQCNIG